MGSRLCTHVARSEGLVFGARLQSDSEYGIIDLLQGPGVTQGLVGVVAVGQGEEQRVVGQEDQPPCRQALGPSMAQQGGLLRAPQQRLVHA